MRFLIAAAVLGALIGVAPALDYTPGNDPFAVSARTGPGAVVCPAGVCVDCPCTPGRGCGCQNSQPVARSVRGAAAGPWTVSRLDMTPGAVARPPLPQPNPVPVAPVASAAPIVTYSVPAYQSGAIVDPGAFQSGFPAVSGFPTTGTVCVNGVCYPAGGFGTGIGGGVMGDVCSNGSCGSGFAAPAGRSGLFGRRR